MIQVDNLSKSYGSLQAVDSISFQVAAGECFGLLGPNGAGKSTTFSMLAGLIDPDQGVVTINGSSPRVSQTRLQVGIAPQSLAIYEELTAKENLNFFGRLYGLNTSATAERTQWAIELAGLEDRAHHRVSTFSGGMKRRLNIAIALVHRPKILLLDEPTVGVDPQSRNHIFEWIERLKSEGLTIIYSTHYMEEAQRLCDRVAIIDRGKIRAMDTVVSLLTQYGKQSLISGTVQFVPDQVDFPGILSGTDWRVETDEPFELLMQLSGLGVQFQSVQISGSDLESVFLTLTGHGLRD